MTDGHQGVPPPPTKDGQGNSYYHRRETDHATPPREHSRWMDSTKVQVAVFLGILTFGAMAFGAGYSLYNFRNTVESSPTINAEQWQAINHNTQNISSVTDKLDEVIQVVNNTRCFVRARNDEERDACLAESERPVQPTPTRRD